MKKLLTPVIIILLSTTAFAQNANERDTVPRSVLILDDKPSQSLPENKMFIPRSVRNFRPFNADGSMVDVSTKKLNPIMDITDTKSSAIKIDLPHDVFYVGPPMQPKDLKGNRFSFVDDYSYSGIKPLTDRSWVSGGSNRTTYPTAGSIGTATAIYNHMLTDKLLVSGGTTITKYGLHGRQYSETVLSGQAAYRFNDRMNLSLFGDYSIQRKDAGLGSFMDRMYPEMPGQIGYGLRPVASAGMRFDYQVNDWLEVNPGLYTNRYELFGGHNNDYGINGHIGIRAHERVKFHMRGQYSLRYGNKGSSILLQQTMYPQNMYGGGIEFKINQTISIEAGVNRELNPWTGKWETKPYIMPIFHIK